MGVDIPKVNYTGAIREITFGSSNQVTIGGETCYPFHIFEGEMPNPPKIAMEVYDSPPDDWPETAIEPFRDVIHDPVAWAKKCIHTYGAEIICLQLASTDPNGKNLSAEAATDITKRLSDSIEVPLIVWGCEDADKDAETLRSVCEACDGRNLLIGPVQEGNYTKLGAAAIAYKHVVISTSRIDVNLAKQLNILLGNLGVPDGQIAMDPTTGGLGYGIEYTYTIIERMRMAALVQEDERLGFPIVCNLAKEVWKVKEVRIPESEDPKLGDLNKRGVMMEAMTSTLLLLAGTDLLVMRHPEAIALTQDFIAQMRH
ncbi:MAG: acetyl-CoA decarbonylase/synthase complex subunit delta [Armatimonadetes bacterium CG2_30_59_28]|nr:acetyl-CoA decarbonylase/synthase complex subunit delta [Armatimonadota bacterium]OIO96424.1 MAG: acetyl-CoA decarbonylase/synthase complex subunit delta [Armatimonadetes bacterium CG2_30_59_28]PIU66242.1 MAG: acetyl-CoA decarbonylase/synthase complex subunit delta [Armatimonadetes bacterium CG07_land_8_20_14_0_80_59_28]PIX45072.1 MAG: acetyl-CoA decarbonylase/synthase complex subunit delta [Armatimonadetes bacterium CG_4_8_14_3_um_filter_58_9]PJB73349.1 MAG: acetyl-CoA decarbonylase/synthas